MTDHTTAAQATKQETMLTDQSINELWIAQRQYHGGEPTRLSHLEFARAIESALLSKLRAPVADEGKALDLLDTLFTAYENGTPCYEEPDSQGGYLGMAFRIDDDTFRACADLLNKHRPRAAALASAPVAGEAQRPVAWANWKVGTDSYVPYRTRVAAQASVNQSSIAATQEGPYQVVALVPAAPQASKAARDAGIAASGDNYRDSAHFHKTASIAELGAWQRGWNDCRDFDDQQRAALSAQPGAQKGGSE